MAKRKGSLSTVAAFLSNAAQAKMEESQTAPITHIPLAEIRPDPDQPRPLLPTDLATAIGDGRLIPLEALQAWLKRPPTPENLGQQRTELIRLADSIAQHGLINPITVRPIPPDSGQSDNVKYIIVTGERRYWAHLYLLATNRRIQEGETTLSPIRIKASVTAVGVSIRAHQLIENLLREDMDAAEKARGLWGLRYELSGVNHGASTTIGGEVHHGAPSLGADGVNHGAPLVPWSKVEETLGISKRYRIYIASVLQLTPEAQSLIAQYRLTERAIRPITQRLKLYPDLQLRALQQLVAWQEEGSEDDIPERSISKSIEILVEQLLMREEHRTAPAIIATPTMRTKKLHTKIKGTLNLLNRLDEAALDALMIDLATEEASAQAVEDLQSLLSKIEELLAGVRRQVE